MAIERLIFALLLTASTAYSLKSYDSLLLATEWQGTVCMFKVCNEDTSADGVFNLHGLWPNRNDGKHPFSCSRTKLGLKSLPKDLQTSLKSYWSGLYSSQEGFLNHEWSKHGTCWRSDYGNIPSMPQEARPLVLKARNSNVQQPEHYMRLASTLSSKNYNLYSILEKGGITPKDDEAYELEGVYSTISRALGIKNFQISCVRDEAGRTFVQEFRVCLSHNLVPADCYKRKTGSCNGNVFYPKRGSKMKAKKVRRMFQ